MQRMQVESVPAAALMQCYKFCKLANLDVV